MPEISTLSQQSASWATSLIKLESNRKHNLVDTTLILIGKIMGMTLLKWYILRGGRACLYFINKH